MLVFVTSRTVLKHVIGERQRHLEAGAAEGRFADRDATVVKHDDLLNERESQACAALLGSEERTEYAFAERGCDAGPIVVHRNTRHVLRSIQVRMNQNLRRLTAADARLPCVAQEITERLT